MLFNVSNDFKYKRQNYFITKLIENQLMDLLEFLAKVNHPEAQL